MSIKLRAKRVVAVVAAVRLLYFSNCWTQRRPFLSVRTSASTSPAVGGQIRAPLSRALVSSPVGSAMRASVDLAQVLYLKPELPPNPRYGAECRND